MIIEKTIPYKLLIGEPQGHGITYQSDIDNDIAALMIACEVLSHNLESLKERKKEAAGTNLNQVIRKQISDVNRGLSSLNKICYSLLDSYSNFYNLNQEMYNKMVELGKANGEIPKQEND